MINKISGRSECFDIFAANILQPKAISKRAGTLTSLSDELIGSGLRVVKSLAPNVDTLASEAKIPLGFLANSSDGDIIRLSESLMSARGVSSVTDEAFRVVSKFYPKATTYDEFLTMFVKDFKAMSQDLDAVSGPLDAAGLDAFYLKYKRTIDAYKTLKESSSITKALSAENIAAEAAKAAKAAGKKVPQTAEEVAAAAVKKTPQTAEEIAAAATKATNTGKALALGGKALGILPIAIASYGIYSLGSYLLGSNEVKNELDKIAAAIKCIDAIQLTSGSPAAKDRLIIINNLQAYLAADATSKPAQESLCADATTEGSIAHFVSLISSDPGTNLAGFASWQKTDIGIAAASGGIVGGVGGFMLGGLLGAAIGATLGAGVVGTAGWFFVSTYYKDQLNCLSGAVDAIAFISRLAAEKAGGNKRDESAEGFRGPQSDATSSPEASILAKILTAMSENKLVGKRGLDFVNEKRLVTDLLERATSPEIAAIALIKSNYNIATRVKSDTIQNIVGAIDKGAVRANQELKELMQDIIATAPNAIRALEQGQIKTSTILHTRANKMKKISISTNTGTIKKKAEETKASYFGDASSGLQDSLTKSYYAGLTGMYNEKLPSRSSDYKDLYGFQEETGGDLVQQSHSKSVTLADAMGKGGLVENGLEQQEKSNYIATSTPSGNFQSKYAQTLNYLTKLAKAADDQGKKDVSKLINQTIKTLN